jgi:uncharacterized OB-fold protein
LAGSTCKACGEVLLEKRSACEHYGSVQMKAIPLAGRGVYGLIQIQQSAVRKELITSPCSGAHVRVGGPRGGRSILFGETKTGI